MEENKQLGSLDWARTVAAFLVVAIHISPLEQLSADADFFLTGVLSRLAVPLFLMISGYFVCSASASLFSRWSFLKKIALLYLFSSLLYLPIGIYAGHYESLSIAGFLRMLLFDGTFYHLWYFPALILGVLVLTLLQKLPQKKIALGIVILLYLIGLLGDGYWGMIKDLSVISSIYHGYFAVSSYTRGGLLYVPIFLWLGASIREKKPLRGRLCAFLFLLSFALMSAEAFLLRSLGWQRHTAMYLLLPLCAYFLFGTLLTLKAPSRKALRSLSTRIYVLHPAVIVAIRLMARTTGSTRIFVECLPIHYLSVCLFTLLLSILMQMIVKKQKHKLTKASRAWCELDLAALRHNVTLLRERMPKTCELMPAVKANAYGHGILPISKALCEMGVKAFCVASAEEGVTLRKNGIRGEILILGYTSPRELPLVRRYDLIQTVVDLPYAKQLEQFGKPLRVHIALDSGMRRLGERCEDIDRICQIFEIKNLRIEGVFTHLCADDTERETDVAFTKAQIAAFEKAVDTLHQRGYKIPKVHMQASYGVLNYPSPAGDYARVGIALYGVRSRREDLDKANLALRPVLSLKAEIATVKELAAGESAGYGLAFIAEQDMRIAVLTVGYSDGVPRALSCGTGEVLIHGHRARIIGRICMDQLTVDVSRIPNVKAGEIATLIGRDGDEEISVYDWAEKCDTLTNEILSRLGERPSRVIIK